MSQQQLPRPLVSATRTAVQMLWAYLLAFAAKRGLPLPDDLGLWFDAAALAAVGWAWTALIRWMESSELGWVKALARGAMLGLQTKPVYSKSP